MDIAKLTPEERHAVTALMQSPGWTVLMEKLLIPQIQLATQFLDRPQAEQSGRADWLRGVKGGYKNLVEIVYQIGGRENPFERYALGLLSSVQQREIPDLAVAEPASNTHEPLRRRYTNFPV